MKEHFLPYYQERNSAIDMLILHASAFPAEKVLYYLDYYKCSCHYILDLDASLIKVVEEGKAAQHAGLGYWRGSDASLNGRSIGIEICNLSLGQEAYSEAQIAKLIPFCQKIIRKYGLKPYHIVGHSDVAPLRKPDPGAAFPWKKLAREGIGLWFELKNAAKMSENDPAALLKTIGYDTRNEAAIGASAYAFCRRFAPQYIEGAYEPSYLVEHVLPDSYDFMREAKFLQVLKAVAYSYRQASEHF